MQIFGIWQKMSLRASIADSHIKLLFSCDCNVAFGEVESHATSTEGMSSGIGWTNRKRGPACAMNNSRLGNRMLIGGGRAAADDIRRPVATTIGLAGAAPGKLVRAWRF
ncbi:hypothetical protein [Burkholderia stagnalis]|uniref:hypothetical protein n=1 Tax=Burkholderia stagnalis TaxID=1503054 RepID=UPI0012DA69C0|nr:hypothetical protein [Burkholderia stagnalis]